MEANSNLADGINVNQIPPSGDHQQQASVSTKVFKSILERYFIYSRYKIFSILDSGRNMRIAEKLQAGKDEHLDYIIKSMCVLAKHQLKNVCSFLMLWFEKGHQKNILVDSKLSLVYLLKLKNYTLECLYIRTLGEIFELCGGKAGELDENTVDSLQSFSYSVLQQLATTYKGMPPGCLQFLRALCSKLLCSLFNCRFYECSSYFIMQLERPRADGDNSIEQVIRSLWNMKPKLLPMETLQATGHYFREIQNLIVSLKRHDEVALELDLMLVQQLFNITADLTYEVSTPLFQDYVHQSFVRDTRKMDTDTRIMIFTSCLCISDNKVFLAKWKELLPSTLSILGNNNIPSSLVRLVVQFVQKGLWVYTYRVSEEGNLETISKLNLIVRKLFRPKKAHLRFFIYKIVPVEIFCDIILYMSENWLSFVVESILLPILKQVSFNTKKSDHYINSIYQVNIVLLSYLAIIAKIDSKRRPKFPANPNQPSTADYVNNDASKLNTVTLKTSTSLQQYEKAMLSHIQRFILLIHAEYISLLETIVMDAKSTNKHARTLSARQDEIISIENANKLKAIVATYETMLKCVLVCIVPSIDQEDALKKTLVSNVATVLHGPIQTLRKTALAVLSQLICKTPSLTPLIFKTLCNTLSDTTFSTHSFYQSSCISYLNHITFLLDQLLPQSIIKQYIKTKNVSKRPVSNDSMPPGSLFIKGNTHLKGDESTAHTTESNKKHITRFGFILSHKSSVNSHSFSESHFSHQKSLSNSDTSTTSKSTQHEVIKSQISSYPASRLSAVDFCTIRNVIEQTLLLLLCDSTGSVIKMKLMGIAYHIYAISHFFIPGESLYVLLINALSAEESVSSNTSAEDTNKPTFDLTDLFHRIEKTAYPPKILNKIPTNNSTTPASLFHYDKELIISICKDTSCWSMMLLSILKSVRASEKIHYLKYALKKSFHTFMDMSILLEESFSLFDIMHTNSTKKESHSFLSTIGIMASETTPLPYYMLVDEDGALFERINVLVSGASQFISEDSFGDIMNVHSSNVNYPNSYIVPIDSFKSIDSESLLNIGSDAKLNTHHTVGAEKDDDQNIEDVDELLAYLTKKNLTDKTTNRKRIFKPRASDCTGISGTTMKNIPCYTKWINLLTLVSICLCVNESWDDAILASSASTHGIQSLIRGLLAFLWIDDRNITDTIVDIMSNLHSNSFVLYFDAIIMHMSALISEHSMVSSRARHRVMTVFSKLILVLLKNTPVGMQRNMFHAKSMPLVQIYIQLSIHKYNASRGQIPYNHDEIAFQYYFSLWLYHYSKFGALDSTLVTTLIYIHTYLYHSAVTNYVAKIDPEVLKGYPTASDLSILNKSFLSSRKVFCYGTAAQSKRSLIGNNSRLQRESAIQSNYPAIPASTQQKYTAYLKSQKGRFKHLSKFRKPLTTNNNPFGGTAIWVDESDKFDNLPSGEKQDVHDDSGNNHDDKGNNNLIIHVYTLLKTLKRLFLLTERCGVAIYIPKSSIVETPDFNSKDIFMNKFYTNDVLQVLFLILEENNPGLFEIGVSLITRLLEIKSNDNVMMEYMIFCAYHSSKGIADGIFYGISALLQNPNIVKKLGIAKVFTLLLIKTGDPAQPVRDMAMKTISYLTKTMFPEIGIHLPAQKIGIKSELHAATQAQFVESITKERNDMAIFVFLEIFGLVFNSYNHRIIDKHWHRPLLDGLLLWIGYIDVERDLKYCPAIYDFLFKLTAEVIDIYGGGCSELWRRASSSFVNCLFLLDCLFSMTPVYIATPDEYALARKIVVFISRENSEASLEFLTAHLSTNFMFNAKNAYKLKLSGILDCLHDTPLHSLKSDYSNFPLNAMKVTHPTSNDTPKQDSQRTSSYEAMPFTPDRANEANRSQFNSINTRTTHNERRKIFNSLTSTRREHTPPLQNVLSVIDGDVDNDCLTKVFIGNLEVTITYIADILLNLANTLDTEKMATVLHCIFISIDQFSIPVRIYIHQFIANSVMKHHVQTSRSKELAAILLDESNINYTSDDYKTHFTPSKKCGVTSFPDLLYLIIDCLEENNNDLHSPGLAATWTSIAIDWSLSCPPHVLLGLKSWQLIRLLVKRFDGTLLVDLLARIVMVYQEKKTSNYKSDPLNRLMVELLQTLSHLLDLAPPGKLGQYPQLSFIGMIFLQSNDLVLWNFFSQFSKRWVSRYGYPVNFVASLKELGWSRFPGVLKLAERGLTHSRTYTRALKLYCLFFNLSAKPGADIKDFEIQLTGIRQNKQPLSTVELVIGVLIYILPRALRESHPHSSFIADTFTTICHQLDLNGHTNISKLLQIHTKAGFGKTVKSWVDFLCQCINDEIQPDARFINHILNKLYLTYKAKIYPQEVLIVSGSMYKNIYATQSNLFTTTLGSKHDVSPYLLFSKAQLGSRHLEESLGVINDLVQIDKEIDPSVGLELCSALSFNFSFADKDAVYLESDHPTPARENILSQHQGYRNYVQSFENTDQRNSSLIFRPYSIVDQLKDKSIRFSRSEMFSVDKKHKPKQQMWCISKKNIKTTSLQLKHAILSIVKLQTSLVTGELCFNDIPANCVGAMPLSHWSFQCLEMEEEEEASSNDSKLTGLQTRLSFIDPQAAPRTSSTELLDVERKATPVTTSMAIGSDSLALPSVSINKSATPSDKSTTPTQLGLAKKDTSFISDKEAILHIIDDLRAFLSSQ